MSVIYERKTNKSVSEAITSLKENLKANNFGVLWELNFKDKIEESNLTFKEDYVVLEVCNPGYAKQVLEKNFKVGYALPCKMVVRSENNETFIGMINPESLISLFNAPGLDDMVQTVRLTLEKSIDQSI